MMFDNKISINVGSETDDELKKSIIDSIKEFGGILMDERSYQVGGQDILIMEYKLGRSKMTIEIETYAGITLKGDKRIINDILKES